MANSPFERLRDRPGGGVRWGMVTKMQMLLTSPGVVAPGGVPKLDVVKALATLKAASNPVGVVSNRAKPAWFDSAFAGTQVQFIQSPGRQSGGIVSTNAKRLGLHPYDTIVLAGTNDDIRMGKNGGAVLVAAGWSSDQYVKSLGIWVANGTDLQETLSLMAGWTGMWWFEHVGPDYSVRSLCDLSSYYVPIDQQEFADRVKRVVKDGGPQLKALQAIVCRSLLASLPKKARLMWGLYPSSASQNDDTDTLSELAHRLRTTVSGVHFAKRGEPLFIRHRPTVPRHLGGSDRTDPSGQICSIHLNPAYRGKIGGRHVVVLDDCATYGLSIGVATAFLKAAGAGSVMGVTLGKFGNRLHMYDIQLDADPFAPVSSGAYTLRSSPTKVTGTTSATAQKTLHTLLP